MLKLKRVEIQGFKSFHDRTEMKFSGNGIAAVVGPNGCGKSNLSDAISWVLGEQSAKSLRGARMEDVIFAGTRDRKPLSMASVTMTLVPDESVVAPIHIVPLDTGQEEIAAPVEGANGFHADFNGHNGNGHLSESEPSARVKADVIKAAEHRGEITITRRLYRSGESEYLINRKAARLRDIQDLFLGTGLGPESYAIIEQGRIGQILSNKPQDRRNVIEEAAGITKFRTRKRLAEARLESAKQNLSRVFDILEEVTRQVNSLKRQAAKTKRYGELKDEAAGYLRQVLSAKYALLERSTAQLVIELNLATSELTNAQSSLGELEETHAAQLEKSHETEEQLRALRKALADLQLEAERVRGQIEYQTRQIQQIDARLTAGRDEVEALAREQQVRAAEFGQQTAALRDMQEQLSAARGQLDAKAVERQAAQQNLAAKESGLEGLRQQVLRLLNESATLKNRITQVEAQFAAADRDTARAKAEETQALSDQERVQQLKTQLSDRLQARQTELVSVTDQRRDVDKRLGERRAQASTQRQNLDRLRTEFSRVKARRESLENILQHRSYTTDTVKRLFTAVEGQRSSGFKPVGVLGDFLEVDTHVEKAAEEFLHEELEYVVVEAWVDAECGIELMRGELNGRATFLVETAGGSEQATESTAFAVPVVENGRLTPLASALRLTNGLTGLPLAQLPRIAYCYVTAERELAQRLAPQFPHCWFLTTDGVSYQGHAVTGGKKSGAGPLVLKRELREVRQLEGARARELNTAQSELAEAEREIQGLTQDLETLRNRQQAQEKDVLALDHETRKLAEEFQRVQTRLSNVRLELNRIGADRVRLDENVTRDRAVLEKAEVARAEQEAALETARGELSALQQAAAAVHEDHAALRAGVAGLEERQRSIGAHCARLDHQLKELLNRRGNLDRESEGLINERVQLAASNTGLEEQRDRLCAALGAHEKDVSALAAVETEVRAAAAALEEQIKAVRARTQLQADRRSELQVAMARAESDLKHLDDTCRNELSVGIAELAAITEVATETAELSDLEARYTDLRKKIEALGPVNPQALEEFEEAQSRQEFLTVQRQDLLDSIRDTEKAIGDIDAESRKRFVEAFKAINANFRELFQTLFGGGTGEMRLTDEENASESGIDIVASPPGKRLQSVLLLSGGEKSLTAMALLMAIFQYTPSPFCILDEVDAPLDEPNIERLTRLIREMSEETQFILITHSKRTMEAAQSLYGVTMQEPGVSKLVSVRFGKEEKSVVAKAVQRNLQPTLV